MTKHYTIDLVEEHEAVNFYNIHLDAEELSELERFFEKFPAGSPYDEDIDTIIAWLDRIGEKGALERYFRYEGRYGDGVSAIPIETSRLRLYCLRLSEKILIFGNGDVKTTDSWQNSSTLSEYVEMLITTSKYIASRVNRGPIIVCDKEIIGNLKFTTDEKK